MSAVSFVIGNNYTKSRSKERLDSSRYRRKVYSWAPYVHFFNGDVDLVQKVTFELMGSSKKQTLHCPVQLTGYEGWRFQAARIRTFARCKTVLVIIIGRGRTMLKRYYRFGLASGGRESRTMTFTERRANKLLRPVAIPNQEFGIELELSTSSNTSTRDVAELIRAYASVNVEDMMGDYIAACSTNHVWVLMADSSLICSRDDPACNRFELKSPILKGGKGLNEIDRVMRALRDIHSSIKVNYSMGFHVHVNISKLSKLELTTVCQNFVKYEQAISSLMPPSRQDGNKYIKSNRIAVGATKGYTWDMGDMLASCGSTEELAKMMCPGDKYYKLNMRPFLGKGNSYKPTIEFRQHSATYNNVKIKNWIRFLMFFVHNSARRTPPSPLSGRVGNREMFDMLMMRVVKDRYLHDYYSERQLKFLEEESGDCCEGCVSGNGCEAQMLK